MPERRQFPRIKGPFEGHWHGGRESREVRISDIGLGGCFVETMVQPTTGERTAVTVKFHTGQTMTLTGHVAYAEPGLGFAVKFDELSPADLETLKSHLPEQGP